MIQTAIWVPPSLCGCQLKMTANFMGESINGGITYRHPKPFTITHIDIVNCCARHQVVLTGVMPDIAHLYETNSITGKQFQQRGYLSHPISNPSSAQILYQYLCGHKGQTHSFPCGCASHMWGDFSGNFTYADNPDVNQKCFKHVNDTLDMQQAQADFNVAQSAN